MFGATLALTAVRRLRDVSGARGRRADGAGSRHPGAVRHPVRLDRAVLRQHARRADRAGDAADRRARHRRRRAAAGARQPHRAAAADLQRGPGSRLRARAGGLRIGRRDRRGRRLRRVHPERHHRPGHLHRRGSRVPGAARAARRRTNIFYRHRPKNDAKKAGNIAEWVRRFGGAYDAHGRARRRLADDRRHAGAARRRDGAQSGRRPDPDLPRDGQRHDAVRAPAAVRRPALRPADRARPRLVARRRQQLLGPQRHHPHARLRGPCGPAGAVRAAPDRRTYPEPRLRRGGADAARRLGDPHGARARRLLRGIPALAHRICGARPALVPGQSAAHGRAAGARPALR